MERGDTATAPGRGGELDSEDRTEQEAGQARREEIHDHVQDHRFAGRQRSQQVLLPLQDHLLDLSAANLLEASLEERFAPPVKQIVLPFFGRPQKFRAHGRSCSERNQQRNPNRDAQGYSEFPEQPPNDAPHQ